MTNSRIPLPLSAIIIKDRFYRSYQQKRVLHNNAFHQPFFTVRALSCAPFARPYTQDASFLSCADEFFEDNPLIAATLQPATRVKYAVALENFRASSIANERSKLSLDQRLTIYIQERFITNARPGQRQEMANLICVLLLMYPSLREQLGLARRTITGWKALKPSRSSAPFTKQIVMAFAWYMISRRQLDAATILLVSFAGCLRISEALSLTWKHVALPGDLRLSAYSDETAGLNISDAKTARYTGKLQFVKITDSYATQWLRELRKIGNSSQARIAPISYHQYSEMLKQATAHYGLSDVPFTSHSARIGKATEDFIKGIPVDQIAIHGRWKSLNSLRYYLNNGRAWILDTPMSSEKQARLKSAALQLDTLLRV